jgi:hypothetical protein
VLLRGRFKDRPATMTTSTAAIPSLRLRVIRGFLWNKSPIFFFPNNGPRMPELFLIVSRRNAATTQQRSWRVSVLALAG